MLVGDVGERRRALVGRDHEVRVVAVVAHDVARGGTTVAVDDVVGDVEQRADERRGRRRRPRAPASFDHEPALGADGDDQRVLDHLRLHQPEDLGAEVLVAVRPAQSAAGDRPAAQVHALGDLRVHEDLDPRPRLGQQRDRRGVELERQRVGCRSQWLVRRTARTTVRYRVRMRSSSRLATASISVTMRASSSWARAGSAARDRAAPRTARRASRRCRGARAGST